MKQTFLIPDPILTVPLNNRMFQVCPAPILKKKKAN